MLASGGERRVSQRETVMTNKKPCEKSGLHGLQVELCRERKRMPEAALYTCRGRNSYTLVVFQCWDKSSCSQILTRGSNIHTKEVCRVDLSVPELCRARAYWGGRFATS